MSKCHQYVEHYRLAATSADVYPAVLWVVPSDYRCLQLRRSIRADPNLPNWLFTVTTIAHLPETIAAGPTVDIPSEPATDGGF